MRSTDKSVLTNLTQTKVRCNGCNRQMFLGSKTNDHLLNDVIPNFQYCARTMQFSTWSSLAVPHNLISIPIGE